MTEAFPAVKNKIANQFNIGARVFLFIGFLSLLLWIIGLWGESTGYYFDFIKKIPIYQEYNETYNVEIDKLRNLRNKVTTVLEAQLLDSLERSINMSRKALEFNIKFSYIFFIRLLGSSALLNLALGFLFLHYCKQIRK